MNDPLAVLCQFTVNNQQATLNLKQRCVRQGAPLFRSRVLHNNNVITSNYFEFITRSAYEWNSCHKTDLFTRSLNEKVNAKARLTARLQLIMHPLSLERVHSSSSPPNIHTAEVNDLVEFSKPPLKKRSLFPAIRTRTKLCLWVKFLRKWPAWPVLRVKLDRWLFAKVSIIGEFSFIEHTIGL